MAISAEGKIGISLTLLFAIGGGAVMVAPEQQVWIGWTIITAALLGLVVLGSYHVATTSAFAKGRRKMISLTGMVVSALCFLVFFAAYFRSAAYGSKKIGPLVWYYPPGIQLTEDDQKRLHVFLLMVAVKNISDDPQKLDSATIWSNTSGDKFELGILNGNDVVLLSGANPLPPGKQYNLVVKLGQTFGPDKGPLAVDFIPKWSKIRIVAKYQDYEYKQTFDLEPEIRKAMSAQGASH